MSRHEKFHFDTLEALREKTYALGVDIAYDEDLSPLFQSRTVGGRVAANAIAALPMEGCDSEADGRPSPLVEARYLRLARGGYGLLWWEANAIVAEGRANPLQMMLTEANVGAFASLVKRVGDVCEAENGFRPLNVLQLTHSGRYSRPEGHVGRPLVPQRDPILDRGNETVVTDAYLDSLVERYARSARLAQEAGFDGVDIKACHRYLMSELLASFTREGRYGGSFENRTRLLLSAVAAVREACGPDFLVACRFNVFDAHPHPYGFGCAKEDAWTFDPTEPVALVRALSKAGVGLLSNSGGNPYHIHPQVTRPFDTSSYGIPIPDEHPLESCARLFRLTAVVQEAAGDIPVVGNGYSWLRQFLPYAASANLRAGRCAFLGVGRETFAYPDFVRDLREKGKMDPTKCCIACSKCTQIMRDHGTTGCVIRNAATYAPLYRTFNAEATLRENRK